MHVNDAPTISVDQIGHVLTYWHAYKTTLNALSQIKKIPITVRVVLPVYAALLEKLRWALTDYFLSLAGVVLVARRGLTLAACALGRRDDRSRWLVMRLRRWMLRMARARSSFSVSGRTSRSASLDGSLESSNFSASLQPQRVWKLLIHHMTQSSR